MTTTIALFTSLLAVIGFFVARSDRDPTLQFVCYLIAISTLAYVVIPILVDAYLTL